MVYAAMTFWLLLLIFTAWGVSVILSDLIKPRWVNSLLLPGTLVAQLGHVVALLVTGATIEHTTLLTEGDSAEPETTPQPKPRIPIIGPLIIAMLPLLSCALALYMVMDIWGQGAVAALADQPIAMTVPTSLAAFWQILRDAVTLTERMFGAALQSNLYDWRNWLFAYLVICLTVRMAPLPGTLRGAVGAIFILGILSALVGQVYPSMTASLTSAWTLVCFAIGSLLCLLLISLMVRGGKNFVRLMLSS
jgi:hypothetical protein